MKISPYTYDMTQCVYVDGSGTEITVCGGGATKVKTGGRWRRRGGAGGRKREEVIATRELVGYAAFPL